MKTLSLLSLLLLSACAGTGEIYRSEVVPSKQAQVVVYRPNLFVGMMRSPRIEINGQETCDLAKGSHIVRNVNPGPVTISASQWDLPGTSRLTIPAQPGQRYYVRTVYNNDKVMAGSLGGYTGIFAAEASNEPSGPFLIKLVPEGMARGEVAKTNEATSCE